MNGRLSHSGRTLQELFRKCGLARLKPTYRGMHFLVVTSQESNGRDLCALISQLRWSVRILLVLRLGSFGVRRGMPRRTPKTAKRRQVLCKPLRGSGSRDPASPLSLLALQFELEVI